MPQRRIGASARFSQKIEAAKMPAEVKPRPHAPLGPVGDRGVKVSFTEIFCYIYEIKEPGMPGLFMEFFIICFI